MRLLHNWREVLKRAWSVRLIILAAVLNGLEAVLWVAGPFLPLPPGALALAAGFVSLAALPARLMAQKGLPNE